MKSLSTTKSTVLFIAAIAASIVVAPTAVRAQGNSAPGTPVEVTPEFVCNPNATRWNTPGGKGGYFAREVQDLHVYNGKIYTAGGDWGAFSNQGPVPIFAIDPATGSFTNEFEAGTELITDFKEFSDGRLWAGSVDNRESHENAGHFFRRELDGMWTNLTSCISGHNGATANYAAHIWDIAEFGGKFFTAGYGICASSNWGDTRMTDATPDLTTPYRTYFESSTSVWIAGQNRFNVGQARKFAAFMPFDDDLFCFSMDYGYKYYMDIFEWEEWRWDASLGKFVASLVPWSDIAPGITEEDKAITVSSAMSDYLDFDIRPSHCRKFGLRMLYLIEGIKTNVAGHSRPWAAYSAVNVNHHVKATKIDLGGARPFDIHVSDDAAYIVAAKGTEMGSVVTNSVWKTEDGVTFTELFYFATNRHATALCKYGDDFYIGMGYSTNVCNIWKNLPKDPELSGDIYRVNLEGGSQGGGDPQGGDDPQGDPTATNTIRVAGWAMSNKEVYSDMSDRSALYSKLAEQGVDFVYICNGKGDDEYGSADYGFVKCQTALNSNSYYQMVLGFNGAKYTLLSSTDTMTIGSQAYFNSNAIVTQGLYLEDNTTKERLFFMAYAGTWANFANAATQSWFQWVLSDIATYYHCEKVILIFPVSHSQPNMEPYLTGSCNFDEIHYNTNVTDFAVFASSGKFSLSSVQSVVASDVSANAEGLFTLAHTPKSTVTFNVRFLDKDGVTVIDEIVVADGGAAIPPATLPSHEGEHFVCWMLGENVYDITTAVTSNLTLVASYAANVDDSVQEIGSYGEFAAAITEDSPAGAKYRLTADINLAPWSAVDFRGVLDGNGHTLEGLVSPLFNAISGGCVQNLAIASAAVNENVKGGSVGFIARTLECGASVSNCTIKAGCLLQAGNNMRCGAIVGNVVKGEAYAGAEFSGIFDCTNHAAIEKTTGDYNTTFGCGGIVGNIDVSLPDGQSSVECRIERCFNDGTLSSTNVACNLGGIVGYAMINSDAGALSIVDCQNAGAITNTSTETSSMYVTTHAGGIIGNVGGPCHGVIEISRCANRGVILSGYEPADSSFSKKCAGGLVGNVTSIHGGARLSIVDSANYGTVSGNRAAGLVAQIGVNVNHSGTSVVISNVANYATISGVTNVAQAIGCSTVPGVAHVRRIFNAFFETSGNQGVPLFGDAATSGDFALDGVIASNATSHGYSASTDKNVLNSNAKEAGLVPWVQGQVGGVIVPELSCFRKRVPRFVISLR